MPFLQTPADSSGMGSFLQKSVGHDEVLNLGPVVIEGSATISFLQDSMLDQEEEMVLLQIIHQYMMWWDYPEV